MNIKLENMALFYFKNLLFKRKYCSLDSKSFAIIKKRGQILFSKKKTPIRFT